MTEIYLHGQLGKEFGSKWVMDLDDRSPAGAVRCIEAMRPGFLNAIERLIPDVEGFQVNANGYDVSDRELELQGCNVIHFTPILRGADTKGIIQIVAGVALIAVGVAMMFVPGFQIFGAYSAMIGLNLGMAGLAIALGGVARLLMSTPSLDATDPTKQRASYMFNGIVNTIGEGACVPVLFGELIIGSVVVSAGGDATDKLGPGATSDREGVSEPRGRGGAAPIATNRHHGGEDE
jgi:predicted phage tail protein